MKLQKHCVLIEIFVFFDFFWILKRDWGGWKGSREKIGAGEMEERKHCVLIEFFDFFDYEIAKTLCFN